MRSISYKNLLYTLIAISTLGITIGGIYVLATSEVESRSAQAWGLTYTMLAWIAFLGIVIKAMIYAIREYQQRLPLTTPEYTERTKWASIFLYVFCTAVLCGLLAWSLVIYITKFETIDDDRLWTFFKVTFWYNGIVTSWVVGIGLGLLASSWLRRVLLGES